MDRLKKTSKLLYVVGRQSEIAVGVFKDLLGEKAVEVRCDGRIAPQELESNCTLLFLEGSGCYFGTAERLTQSGFDKKVIFCLDDLSLVRLSNEVSHELFWLSPNNPSQRLGGLVDKFQGAYFQEDELTVSIGKETSRFLIPESKILSPSFKNILLAGALSAKFYGLSKEATQSGLETAMKTLNKPEWKVFST